MSNAGSVMNKPRLQVRNVSYSKSALSKPAWKMVVAGTMAMIFGFALIEPGQSAAQDPSSKSEDPNPRKSNDDSKKNRRRNQEKGGAAAKGKGQEKPSTKSGPEHRFEISPPVRDYDIVLGRPTDTTITVSVMSQKPLEVFLRYGLAAAATLRETDRRNLQPNEPAEWLLEGLAPDQEHRYELHAKAVDSADFEKRSAHTFRTARKPGSGFSFAVQADSHLDQATRADVYSKTLETIEAEKPDFFVDLGDTFMTDKFPNHLQSMPQYLAQRDFLGRVARSGALFLVLGNHDGERGDRFNGSADSMPGWSNTLRKRLFPNPEPNGFYSGNNVETPPLGRLQNYYAWTWGDALLIVLDPFWPTRERARGAEAPADANWSRTLGDEQYKWLKKTLEASKARYKFVFIHHLVGGLDRSARGGAEAAKLYEWGGRSASGENEFAKYRPGWTMPIHEMLVKHEVSAVFHGHDHFYARQELDGIAYVLVAQPGHAGGGDAGRSAEQYGYVTGVMKSPPGHVLVKISPTEATVEYVRTEVHRDGKGANDHDNSGDRFLILPR